MTWLKRNVRVDTWLTIAVLIIGFISTGAVRAYKQGELETKTDEQESSITLNTNHRITAEAQPEMVPKAQFDDLKEDVSDLKDGQKEIVKLLASGFKQLKCYHFLAIWDNVVFQ